jgi:hypothetical protein
MNKLLRKLLVLSLLILPIGQALADDYADTIKVFQTAGESGKFFNTSYGYAVFPTIGKGGIGFGGAQGGCTPGASMLATLRWRRLPWDFSWAARPSARSYFLKTNVHSTNSPVEILRSARKHQR